LEAREVDIVRIELIDFDDFAASRGRFARLSQRRYG